MEELILTVFWFHPAVAWVVNRIRLSREEAVDEEVVRRFSARKPYMCAPLEIASGGAGTLAHLADVLDRGHASAVLAASIFHFGTFTVPQAKDYLSAKGLPVRR